MRKEIAELAFPILRHGLFLKERLRRGDKCSLAAEQTELKRLFRTSDKGAAAEAPEGFLGVRYPLACWLDEIFIVDSDSPWKSEWREKTMEIALFNKRDRAYLFWEQARQAEARSDNDALEVFYLCVVLGFRGDLRDKINELLDWREAVEERLVQGRSEEWPDKPPELPLAETNVPPLRARDRLRWLLLCGAVVLGLAIVMLVFAVVHNLGKS